MDKEYPPLYFFGKGFNYSQDGPGNRLVYHLQGCNLHCPWCSNPEGLAAARGSSVSVDRVLDEALSCRAMFFDGGGVTLTGGEVCVQADAACLLLALLRKKGIHTCVETNASLAQFPAISKHTDYLIADYKHPDGAVLKRATGADIVRIQNNIEARVREAAQLHIRVTLVHGFNDSEEELNGFIAYFTSLTKLNRGCDITFELLTYHEYGRDKWEKLSMPYTVRDGFVAGQTAELFSRAFVKNRLKLIST